MKADDWRHRAGCRGHDPELFFPVSEKGPGAEQTAQAKQVCEGCPVRAECLIWALDNGLGFGVFGGLSEAERREFSARMPRIPRISA